MNGLDVETEKKIKSIFSLFSEIDKVVLYGSRAKGNYKTGSDIDLTLYGKNLNLKTIYKIQDKLDELYLPYKFDISIYEHIDNPDLKEHINRVGKIFYTVETGLKPVSTEGWEIKKLGEVCEIINGGTPDTKIKDFWDGQNLWITPKDMGKLENIFVDETERKITNLGLKNSSAKMLPINSIILSSRAPIGHLAINIKEMSTNQGCKGIIPNKNLNYLFLYYYLKKSVELLNNLGSGTTFKELSGSKLADVNIPIPPLSEQKRIVAILDNAFTGIKKAKENAEKNLANAKELFESYLNRIFNNPVEDWEEKRLGEIYDITSSKRVFEAEWKREGVPFYRAREIVKLAQQGYVNNELFISYEMYDLYSIKYGIPKENDIMVTGVGTLGICYVVKKDDKFYFKDGNIIWLKKKSDINSQFIEYAFKSELLKKQINDSQGATVGTYTIIRAKNTRIFVPPLCVQQSIVSKLDELSAETKRLEEIYKKKLDDLEELKKAILEKAFRGEM